MLQLLILIILFIFSATEAFPHHQFLQALVADFNNQQELFAKNKFKILNNSLYSFVDEDANNTEKGGCLKIKYDFSSQGSNAECGIWLDLRGIKLLPEQIFLTIFARGDANDGFIKMVKVKLVAGKVECAYTVRGVRDNWQQFAIPLSDFKQIEDFTKLTDLYITIDNSLAGGEKGAVYIDEVAFIN